MTSHRRWVERRINSLNPETQFDEIIRLVSDYRTTSVVMNLIYMVALSGVLLPKHGQDITAATGNTVHKAEDRTRGTSDAFFTWFSNGSNSDVTRASIDRLNKYHGGMAKLFPEAFEPNEDWIYATCALGLFSTRARENLGLRPETPAMQTAWHHFLGNIASHLRGPHGEITDYPKDFAALRRQLEEYENRDWPKLPLGHEIMTAVVQAFCDRWFPRPFHWFARNLALIILPKQHRNIHQLPDPNPLASVIVRRTVQLSSWWSRNFASDPRIPFSVVRTTPEFKARAARQVERMQRLTEARIRSGKIKVPPPPDGGVSKQQILGEGVGITAVGQGA